MLVFRSPVSTRSAFYLTIIHVNASEALNDHAADRPDSYQRLLPDGQQRMQ